MAARALLAAIGLLLLLFFARPAAPARPVEEWRLAMDTVVKVELYVAADEAPALMEAAFAEIDRIDSLMSGYSDLSEVSYINRTAGARAVACSPDMAQVLSRSLHFARHSEGAFDVSLGALTRLWNIPDAVAPPGTAQIDSALALSGPGRVYLEDSRVRFERPGVQLDLGAVAKGFAVDRAVDRLIEAGAAAGLIEAGGDILYWGEKPDGRPWRFGVQHPRDREHIVAAADVGLPAIATSGDYERFFEHGGRRFHHLLDPATGYPARHAVSATVWTHNAMDADILATAVFVLGPERGLDWVESLAATECLVFYQEEDTLLHRATSGVADKLEFLHKSELMF